MTRILSILCLLLGLAAPALAQREPPFVLDDPQARRIAAARAHETGMYGPYCAMVSIFSVAEPGGQGVRLFVGLVDDIYDRGARVRLWRGPVADSWSHLAPVPEYVSRVDVANPARYRLRREVIVLGDGRYISPMEIDLEAVPPQVRLLEKTHGAPGSPDASPLEEITPLSASMRMLPRLVRKTSFSTFSMQLNSYKILPGEIDPGPSRPPVGEAWQSTMNSHLLVVSPSDRPDKAVAYFLPMRPEGWTMERWLPSSPRNHGRFVLEMFAGYLYPDDGGNLMVLYSRNRVTAGMDGMSITPLDTGYTYDVGREQFEKPRPAAKPRR